MIETPSRKTSIAVRFLWVFVAILLSANACTQRVPDSLVILDPVFPVVAPEAARIFGLRGRKTITLPFEASETLYASLAETKASVLFLSPLLATELNRILDTLPDIKLVHTGGASIKPRKGLYSAFFSPIDAAEKAGSMLAEKAQSLPADALCIGIFLNGSKEAIARFTESYMAGKPGNTPIIENIATPWSNETANKLKVLDIRQAFIAVPGKDGARWARELVAGSTYVLLEAAFGGTPDTSIDGLLVWDFENTLAELIDRLNTSDSATLDGKWKILE